MMRHRYSVLASLVLFLGAAACGGGSDESVEGASASDDSDEADDSAAASDDDADDGAADDSSADDASDNSSADDSSTGDDPTQDDVSQTTDDVDGDDSTDDDTNTDDSSLAEPTGSSSVPNVSWPELGEECDEAVQCGGGDGMGGDGPVCVTDQADFGFEGMLPGGMCTARCDEGSNVCGATGGCVPFEFESGEEAHYCFDTCFYSEAVEKCGESINRVCLLLDFESGLGVCIPKCFSDAECDGGYCDPYTGSCVDEPPTGAVDGSECDVPEDCLGGICLRLTAEDEFGTCISECSVHPETYACHRDLGDTSPVPSACFPHLELLYLGILPAFKDLGHCVPTCQVGAGCGTDGWTCIPADDPEYVEDVGADGFCLPTFLLPPELVAELEGNESPTTDDAAADDAAADDAASDDPADDDTAATDDVAADDTAADDVAADDTATDEAAADAGAD